MNVDMPARLLILAAGMAGAAGVALSALAAHAGGGNLSTAASFMLFHAPAFLALGLAGGGRRALRIGSAVLLAGLVLFCGDLLTRHYLGTRLFPFTAPAGGALMIAGWLAIGLGTFATR